MTRDEGPTRGPGAGRALARRLRRAGARLRWRQLVEGARAGLPLALLAAGGLVATARLRPDRLGGATSIAASAVAALALVTVASAAWRARRRAHPLEVALLLDRAMGSREVVATAAWCAGRDDGEERARRALALLDRAREDARFPIRAPRRRWPAALAAAAAVAACFLPPIRGAEPGAPEPPDPTVTAAAQALAERAEEIEAELSEHAPPEEVRRILEGLGEVAETLSESATDRETAALELRRLEQDVERERRRLRAADSGALQRALSSLELAALTRSQARRAAEGESADLAESLRRLGEDFATGTSFEERSLDLLAARLLDAVDELRDSAHSELADQLEAIADAVETGDLEEAARLMEELLESGRLDGLQDDVAVDEALADARAALRQALASMGQARPDQQLDPRVRELASRLHEAADDLAGAQRERLAGQVREAARQVEREELDRALRDLERLLESGALQEPSGSPEGDAAAARAEGLIRAALGGLQQALSARSGGWSGPRDRAGRPVLPRDWGVGTTDEAQPSYPVAPGGSQSDRQSDETSDWREAYEALHDSLLLDEAKGRSSRVSGRVSEGSHVAVPTWTASPGREDAHSPELVLPPRYERAREQALAREDIPAGYEGSVERYFDAIRSGGRNGPTTSDEDADGGSP